MFTSVLSGTDLDREVRKALSQYVDKSKSFSAHDITTQVRKNLGDKVEVRHDYVRPIVHDLMFVDANYERVSDGTKFIYKSKTKTLIQPLGIGALQVSSNTQQPPQLIGGSLYVYPRSEGRVTVPASVLKKVGFKAHDYVRACLFGSNGIEIVKDTGSVVNGDKFKLDKYGSFRLRKCYVNGFKKFKIATSPTKSLVVLYGEN